MQNERENKHRDRKKQTKKQNSLFRVVINLATHGTHFSQNNIETGRIRKSLGSIWFIIQIKSASDFESMALVEMLHKTIYVNMMML